VRSYGPCPDCYPSCGSGEICCPGCFDSLFCVKVLYGQSCPIQNCYGYY
jgi:hypothetical protein